MYAGTPERKVSSALLLPREQLALVEAPVGCLHGTEPTSEQPALSPKTRPGGRRVARAARAQFLALVPRGQWAQEQSQDREGPGLTSCGVSPSLGARPGGFWAWQGHRGEGLSPLGLGVKWRQQGPRGAAVLVI